MFISIALWKKSYAIVIFALTCVALFQMDSRARLAATAGLPGYADGSWRSLSVLTLNFTRYWMRAGQDFPLPLLHQEPYHLESLEWPSKVYTSYPPGFVLPVYLAAKWEGKEPDLGKVMRMSLWLHRFIAFLIGLFVLLCGLRILYPPASALTGAAATAVFYGLPSVNHFYPAAWWADTVAPASVLLLLIYEWFLRPKGRVKYGAWSSALEVLLFFALAYVDWLPALTLLVCGVLRWRGGEGARTYLTPAIAVFFVAALQFISVLQQGVFEAFLIKLEQRMGLLPVPNEVISTPGWRPLLEAEMGPLAFPLFVFACLLSVGLVGWHLFRRRISLPGVFLIWILLPSTLHFLLLHQHYQGHPYNVVKWGMVLAMLPAAGLLSSRRKVVWASSALAVLSALWVLLAGSRSFVVRNVEASLAERLACQLLMENQRFEDIAITPEISFAEGLPMQGSCYYLVHRVESERDLAALLSALPPESRGKLRQVWWISSHPPTEEWRGRLGDFVSIGTVWLAPVRKYAGS